MNIKYVLAVAALAVGSMASTSAMALECSGITVPDNLATAVVNSQVSGFSYKINKRKTLVVHGVESLSGSSCNIRAKLNVTLKRKIRADAHGTVTVKGGLRLKDGKVCIANASVADVDLSRTLGIGEAIYKKVANKALPKNLCF